MILFSPDSTHAIKIFNRFWHVWFYWILIFCYDHAVYYYDHITVSWWVNQWGPHYTLPVYVIIPHTADCLVPQLHFFLNFATCFQQSPIPTKTTIFETKWYSRSVLNLKLYLGSEWKVSVLKRQCRVFIQAMLGLSFYLLRTSKIISAQKALHVWKRQSALIIACYKRLNWVVVCKREKTPIFDTIRVGLRERRRT